MGTKTLIAAAAILSASLTIIGLALPAAATASQLLSLQIGASVTPLIPLGYNFAAGVVGAPASPAAPPAIQSPVVNVGRSAIDELQTHASQIGALAGIGARWRAVATGVTSLAHLVVTSTRPFNPAQRELIGRRGYTAVEAAWQSGLKIHAEINLLSAVMSNPDLGELTAIAASRRVCVECAADLLQLGIRVLTSLRRW